MNTDARMTPRCGGRTGFQFISYGVKWALNAAEFGDERRLANEHWHGSEWKAYELQQSRFHSYEPEYEGYESDGYGPDGYYHSMARMDMNGIVTSTRNI